MFFFKLWSESDAFELFYVPALSTLKKATWVAEACYWPLCSTITSIKPTCICGSFNN